MTHLERKEAVVRHLQAKLQGNRRDPPIVGGCPESQSAASLATEPGQTPLPEAPRSRRVDFSRASPSHSKGVGPCSPPHSSSEPPGWVVQLKKGTAQGGSFHPAPAKPGGGDVLSKEVGGTSDPPRRSSAQQARPLAKEGGAPAVPVQPGHPAQPWRKPLPHIKALGARPAKPRRPPVVDLEKFGASAHRGMPIHPAAEAPRGAQLGHPKPGYATSAPARFPTQDASSVTGGEDEIYDDVEPAGLIRRAQGFLLSPTCQPPANPCPRGGEDAGRASKGFALLAAAQREAQVPRKMKPMTLKECKKEEKADREFQKKFKFEGSISVLTQMMVDPAVTEKRGGGKNLPLRRGEILDVIQFTNQEQILCRNSQRRYGYVPRTVMLHLDTDIYDDVEIYGRRGGSRCCSPFTKQ
ncbi:PML-RARA-regulated adapter molecule 1 isoform X2 [Pezoporus occidentalis]|uniref:PML-RARA-regulated adapter molecule 1 isoform X2 n=1 Tax=Pezoporus occidentalis TaxID=407982 RepID=UPI002F915CC9